MTAPLQLIELTSFDFHSAAQIALRLDEANTVTWTGSVGSMVTGHLGTGQAFKNPTALTRTWKSGIYDTVYARLFFKVDSTASGQSIAHIQDSGATALFYSGLLAGGAIYVGSGATTWTATSAAVSAGVWHQLEVAVRIEDTEGAFEVRLDGVPVAGLTQTGVDTWPTALRPNGLVFFSNSGLSVDDLVIKVGKGGFSESDFIGRTDGYPVISTLYPTALGAHTGWGVTASSPAHLAVVPADTTNIVQTNVQDERFTMSFDTLPGAADTVQHVKFSAFSRAGGTDTMSHFVRQGNQKEIAHYGGAFAMNTTWVFREHNWPENVRRGRAWSVGNVAGLQFGYARESAPGTTVKIAQVACEVLWSGADASTDRYSTESLADTSSHRHVTCWKITRVDSAVMRFTSHQQPLTIEGKVYEAAGGFDPSAERREGALRERNKDFRGMITSDSVTAEDLRAGRYRGAEVEEFIVDWRYPDFGRFDTTRYWIGTTEWDETEWAAGVNGLTRWLKQPVGNVSARTCKWTLGGVGCFVHLHALRIRAAAVASVGGNPRTQFSAATGDISAGLADDYFAEGIVKWLSGANWGLEFHVKTYTSSSRTFELHAKTPHDITTTDIFTVTPGCRRTKAVCISKYDNVLNFGGMDTVPGTDASLQTPTQ